jgi:hypothetical protein
MQRLRRSAAAFVAIGLVLYAVLFWVAEGLVLRTGHANPFFKIAHAPETSVDWVVLGASHAMPLDFDEVNLALQRDTGLKILNLAATGAGPLYNRFVLEQFLADRRARNILYVVDSFAFHSPTWNEERFADAKLLARTPLQRALTARFVDYALHEGVPATALLDYASGFSKINNRDRFKPDRWEGETQFDRNWRPSASAVKKRIEYLYPHHTEAAARDRYLAELPRLAAAARLAGARMVVVKLPTPAPYRSQLPQEAAFDAALARVLAQAGVEFRDWSAALPEPRFYFDSDHLNRAGVNQLSARWLKPLLLEGRPRGAPA